MNSNHMKNMKILLKPLFLALTAMLTLLGTVRSQYVADLRRTGDIYFEKGDYYSASQYYEKFLGSKQAKVNRDNYKPYMLATVTKGMRKEMGDYEKIVYRLAESYRLYNDYGNAERWYATASQFDSTQYPLARFWYGVSLRANTKFDDAARQFEQFIKTYNRGDDYAERARKELANCRFIQAQLAGRDQYKVKVARLASYINQGGANYAPFWTNGSTFMFTSSRPDSAMLKATKNPYHNALYKTLIVKDTVFGNVEKVNVKVNKDLQQGVASLTFDGKKMFLTRWTNKDGKNMGAIYSSQWNGYEWSEPVKLNSNINVEGFSSQQPFVTQDGKYLVFSSDRPGGSGKYDLWYALLDGSGNPGAAVNMGTAINTREDEQAPYYHAGTQTMVFASNGRIGMGGFDLYGSKGDFNTWTEPKNLGYPVNSTKDDIYFSGRDSKYLLKDAYFSPDRNSVCFLELYHLKKVNRQVTGKIVDCFTKAPLIGAKVSVVDTTQNRVVYSQNIDATGAYTFELEDFQPLKLVAEKKNYITQSLQFSEPPSPEDDTLINPTLCLNHEDTAKPYPVNRPVVLQNIFYDFDKYVLRPESYPVLDTVASVMRMYPNMVVELSAHTDSKGSEKYNLKLSAARAKSCVDYLIRVGIQPQRLLSKGYGKCCPIAPNTKPNGKDNPDGRALNRRTELRVLHY